MGNDLSHEMLQHIPHLRRYARALTGDRERADDLVQDTLERALDRRDAYREDRNLRAWMFTIMHRKFIDQVRRNSKSPRLVPVDEFIPAPQTRPQQESMLDLVRLRDALPLLSSEHRAVLLLIGLEGMSYQETAEILDIPVGTVKSRLSRAREMLQQLLEVGGTSLGRGRVGKPHPRL